jgi:hypothetical protein
MGEKKTGASTTHYSDSGIFAPNVVIPVKPKELPENKNVNTQAHIPTTEFENIPITEDVPLHTTYEDSYSMPFLEAQRRRVMELGYDVGIQSRNLPPSSTEINRFGKTKISSLGSVGVPGNTDSKVNGPNMSPLSQRIQNYNDNSSADYVDQLAPHDPAMALWQKVREFTNVI